MEPEHVVPGYLDYRCMTIDGSGISRTTRCAVDTCPYPIKNYIMTLFGSGKDREGDLTRLIREGCEVHNNSVRARIFSVMDQSKGTGHTCAQNVREKWHSRGQERCSYAVSSMNPFRVLWQVDRTSRHPIFVACPSVQTSEDRHNEPIHSSNRNKDSSSLLLIVNIVVS